MKSNLNQDNPRRKLFWCSFFLFIIIGISVYKTIEITNADINEVEYDVLRDRGGKGCNLMQSLLYLAFGKAGAISFYWILSLVFLFLWVWDYRNYKQKKSEELEQQDLEKKKKEARDSLNKILNRGKKNKRK